MIAATVILLASGLYEQAVVRLLLERFAGHEYLLLDAETGRTLVTQWNDPHQAVPVGSLWKPLLAAAKPEGREFDCRPGMCWLPRGHGRVGLVNALAQSCNAFFLRYAADLPDGAVDAAAKRFGLPPPPGGDPAALIGLNGEWKVLPLVLAQAYSQIVFKSDAVRHGMMSAAIRGTAQGLRIDALAKTGTAACSHASGGPGDGYVVALWPNERPRYLLMLRVHATTGAVAAETAGAMLRVIRDGR